MRLPLEYGVYKNISWTRMFDNESFEESIEHEFPTAYCPEISYDTKVKMHDEFLSQVLADTRGWIEVVKVGELRDEDIKEKYIKYYKGDGPMSPEYLKEILEKYPAAQPNMNNIPRTLMYKNQRYEYTEDLVHHFYYFYYNRRFQVEYGYDNMLPIYLPKEPIHIFSDIIDERMAKKFPPRRKR